MEHRLGGVGDRISTLPWRGVRAHLFCCPAGHHDYAPARECGKEVIVVKKMLIAAIMATSAMLALALSVYAGGGGPCCAG